MARRGVGFWGVFGVWAVVFAASAWAACGPASAGSAVRAYAAASLSEATSFLARAWEGERGGGKARGGEAKVIVGASGLLARQLASGSRGGVYMTADGKWLDWLEERGLVVPSTRRELASNVLALGVKEGSGLWGKDVRVGLERILEGGRLATADEGSSPLGERTREALEWLGMWERVSVRRATAPDAGAARAWTASGAVFGAVLYGTDVRGSGVASAGEFPPESYEAIVYEGALAGRFGDEAEEAAAREFLDFIVSRRGEAVWGELGFGRLLGAERLGGGVLGGV